MHIIHIAAELAPIAKVGGLGDVLLGLSRELAWKGHKVDIVIPFYACINRQDIQNLQVYLPELYSFYQDEWHQNRVWQGKVENLNVYFIECLDARKFFYRQQQYGYEDDIERFLYFSRAALEFLFKAHISPDIIHLHDWQTAAVSLLYVDMYQKMGYNRAKTIFTIHNIEYQGKCSYADLTKIGLQDIATKFHNQTCDNAEPTICNLLKCAINFSAQITTVSPTYAKEVLDSDKGMGLQSTLQENRAKFCGVLNGIDYSYWNPEIDKYLTYNYSTNLESKKHNKEELKKQLHLSTSKNLPLIGCITRLVPQKGLPLILHAIELAKKGLFQFVLLGSSPIQEVEKQFQSLKSSCQADPNIHLELKHEEKLAHQIFAGADLFIIPSIFEPCGLTQMISLKYGTIPIVRKTGGLSDTIFDVQNDHEMPKPNGFVFNEPTCTDFESAITRAVEYWKEDKSRWNELVLNGMKIDFSWNEPASKYLTIYTQ